MISHALIFLCALAGQTPAPAMVNSDPVLLAAISQVESGGHATAIGQRGELGLLQFTRSVWKSHTTEPFRDALDPARALAVGELHLAWLREQLLANGTAATPYNLAAAWNCGATAVIAGKIPRGTRSYAQRVCNLMEEAK